MTVATPESELKLALERTINLASRLDQLSKDFVEEGEGQDNWLRKISDSVDHVMHRMDNLEKPTTPDRAELFTALAAAQKEIENPKEDATADAGSYSYNYAKLSAVLDAVRKPLADQGLSIIQLTDDPGDGVLGIRTILAHESGQTISDHITMAPPRTDPQGVGSCRTYMRRYAILAMLGIADSNDDDAERTKKGEDDYERITATEAEAILVKADDLFGDRADAALAKMLDRLFNGIQRVGDIKAGEAQVAITNLENAAEIMAKTAKKKEKADTDAAKNEKAAKAEHDEKA